MNFKHSGSMGDCIYSLPTILSLTERHGGPANLYLQVDVRANYYEGCQHPAGDTLLNKEIAESLIPLLSAQPGVATCKIWEGEPIDVDLDLFRAMGGDLRYGNLPQHYFYAFDAFYDLSQPWLWVTPKKDIEECLVVARTSRYRNPHINYDFLNDYEPIFIGLTDEWAEFKTEVPSAKWWKTDTFWEAAAVIHGAKAFVSNQCGLFSLAEALKVPRVLECCLWSPNVLPQGGEARAAINQRGFEANVKEIMS